MLKALNITPLKTCFSHTIGPISYEVSPHPLILSVRKWMPGTGIRIRQRC